MMKYLKTALLLTLIAGICALMIAGVNALTSGIIADNAFAKKEALCQEIFPEFDASTSTPVTEGFSSDYIGEKIVANDSSSNLLGYIYTVKGSNAYGAIELLVGINLDYTLKGVRFINNGQSYTQETANHVNDKYVTGLDSGSVSGIDVNCGATYAAKLVKALVESAFADCQGGNN